MGKISLSQLRKLLQWKILTFMHYAVYFQYVVHIFLILNFLSLYCFGFFFNGNSFSVYPFICLIGILRPRSIYSNKTYHIGSHADGSLSRLKRLRYTLKRCCLDPQVLSIIWFYCRTIPIGYLTFCHSERGLWKATL